MKIHDDIDAWIAGALCGALTNEEQNQFEQHLAVCADCRSLYEAQKKMDTLFQRTFAKWKPDANFENRVAENFRRNLAANREVASQSRTRRRFFAPAFVISALARLVQSRPAQAVAAILILAAMIQGGALLTHEPLTANFAPHSFIVTAKEYNGYNSNVNGSVANEAKNEIARRSLFYGGGSSTSGNYKFVNPDAGQVVGNNLVTSDGRSGDLAISQDAITSRLAAGSGRGAQMQLQKKVEEQPREINAEAAESDGANASAFGAPDAARNITMSAPVTRRITASGNAKINLPAIPAMPSLAKTQTAAAAPSSSAGGGSANGDLSQPAVADNRKLIRNARLDFEVAHYETAADTIRKITAEDHGYIDTSDSARGANGKLSGTIVVKIPPANLDRFLLQLRALGDLKNQQITTEDVTKNYFDTDARVRNSQVMEQRLLDMLKTQKGKVTDLLKVEQELGRVRERIEEMQGQLKLWDSLIASATVTIAVSEKDLNAPAAYRLRDLARLSLFAADVEKTFDAAKSDAEKAHAQIVDSQLNRDANGRVAATLSLRLAPDNAEMVISELKTLGRVGDFNEQTQRIARGGNGGDGDSANPDTTKTERDKVVLNLTISPDEEYVSQITNLTLLTTQVAEKAAQIKQESASAGIQVKSSTFNHLANGEENAALTFRLPLAKNADFLEKLKTLGNVEQFTTQRADQVANGERGEPAPAEIALTLHSRGAIVANDNGIFATIRRTLAQGFGALMWSVRMIGVSLAFLAPWAIALALVIWFFVRRRKSKK